MGQASTKLNQCCQVDEENKLLWLDSRDSIYIGIDEENDSLNYKSIKSAIEFQSIVLQKFFFLSLVILQHCKWAVACTLCAPVSIMCSLQNDKFNSLFDISLHREHEDTDNVILIKFIKSCMEEYSFDFSVNNNTLFCQLQISNCFH